MLYVLYASGLVLLKQKKLASVTLHEVIPQAPLQQSSSLVKTSCDDRSTCKDMYVLLI
jgi:hypothetical protein